MMIKQRFEAVKNKELRRMLLANLADNEKYTSAATDRDALKAGFVWAETKEGHDYWQRISFAMTDKTTLDDAYAKVYGAKVHDMPSIPPPLPKIITKGKEYRYYTSKNNIVVHRFVADKSVWHATFDIPSFIAWVKENA